MRPGLATVIVLCFVIAISSALAGSGCDERLTVGSQAAFTASRRGLRALAGRSAASALSDCGRALTTSGHAPGMADLATLLTGFGDRYAFVRMNTKFPTSGLAVLDFPVERWDEVKERSGRLDRFVTPATFDAGIEDD